MDGVLSFRIILLVFFLIGFKQSLKIKIKKITTFICSIKIVCIFASEIKQKGMNTQLVNTYWWWHLQLLRL